MSVIQSTLFPVVHAKFGALVETAISPVPPAAETDADCGLMVIEPDAAAWVTTTKAAPMVIRPHLGKTSAFAATVKLKLPFPAPDVAAPMLIHGTLAAALHEHAADAVTRICPVPPAAANDCAPLTDAGHVDAGAWETVTFSPAAAAEFTVRIRLP